MLRTSPVLDFSVHVLSFPTHLLQSGMSVSAQKRIKSIDVLLDKDPLQCHWDHTDGQIPRVTFSPPLYASFMFTGVLRSDNSTMHRELTHSHRITLRLHYRQQLGPIAVPMKGQSIVIGGHELTRAGEDEGTMKYIQLDRIRLNRRGLSRLARVLQWCQDTHTTPVGEIFTSESLCSTCSPYTSEKALERFRWYPFCQHGPVRQ